jgi:branched-chain amino acid transport system ATP-binding protein
MLEGKGVSKYFGGLAALKDVDFRVEEKEIVGLIGPNGAGKTTLFNVISGVYTPDEGTITFLGEDISNLKPHQISTRGIGRTFQLTKPFLRMTVLDNTMVGPLVRGIDFQEAKKKAESVLEFTGLISEKDNLSSSLTLFDRKRMDLSRGLATDPKLLFLDEYAAGLNPTEILEANHLVRTIREELGITIVWVEHIMKCVMEVCDRLIVLNLGQKIAEGTPVEISNDPNVINAYLGEKYAVEV